MYTYCWIRNYKTIKFEKCKVKKIDVREIRYSSRTNDSFSALKQVSIVYTVVGRNKLGKNPSQELNTIG